MPKPYPCLWLDHEAEDAARFWTGIFPDSRIDRVLTAPADYPSGHKGDVLTVDFTVSGQRFLGLNGGPDFTFDEAISFVIDCADQAEVDRYWDALAEGGGEHGACGWLKDRFGVSWQVVPVRLNEMLASSVPDAAQRAMEAMLTMSKIDVAALEIAFAGKTGRA